MADGLERRIESLERIISASGLGRVGHLDGSYRIVVCDKDGDGDLDPYSSTSWDGDSFSTSTGTINWNTVFGVPTGAKMVFIFVTVRDSGSVGTACAMEFKAKSTTTRNSLQVEAPRSGANYVGNGGGWVAVAADGTSYYGITASGAGTFDVWIRVVAYAR